MSVAVRYLPLSLSLLVLSSCTLHRVDETPLLTVETPLSYSDVPISTQEVGRWWEQYEEPTLNDLMRRVLEENLDLKQAWSRLEQARARTIIAGAARLPQVDLRGNITNNETRDDTMPGLSPDPTTRYLLSASVSYEIDLWKRIQSTVNAAQWAEHASRQDVEATALVLSGTCMDLWLTIQEQRELLQLLEEQVSVNQTLLDLVELRFSVGEASALDVYQQRQTLAGTESQVPSVASALRTAENGLEVLLARAPVHKERLVARPLPKLPPFPRLATPADLIANRPDLRAAHARLLAADYEVGAALAERLPRLDISFSYEVSTLSLANLLQRQVRTLAGNLLQPLIDGGRRSAEVDRRRAVVEELVYAFSDTFLDAVLEVENAMAQEQHQLELLRRLEVQEAAAKANQREAQERYINGLNDYLTVIAAVQSLQTLERRMINERKNLLSIRSQLYRALGGNWTQELSP